MTKKNNQLFLSMEEAVADTDRINNMNPNSKVLHSTEVTWS